MLPYFETDVMKFGEVINFDKGSFKDRLKDDVRFLFDHTGMTLARTISSEYPLQLSEDDTGLYIRALLADSQQGRDLYKSVKGKLITEMSVGINFLLSDAEFGIYKGSNEAWHGSPYYKVHKVNKLNDVSAVSYAAMGGTTIQAQLSAGGYKDQLALITEKIDTSNPDNVILNDNSDNKFIVIEKEDLVLPPRRTIPKGLLV